MKGQAVIVKIFEGIVRVAEINVFDAGFRSLLDAAEIAQDPVGDAATRVSDFASQAVQPGCDGEVVKDVADLTAAFVIRPVLAVLLKPCVAHCRMVGSIAMHKEVAPLAEYV